MCPEFVILEIAHKLSWDFPRNLPKIQETATEPPRALCKTKETRNILGLLFFFFSIRLDSAETPFAETPFSLVPAEKESITGTLRWIKSRDDNYCQEEERTLRVAGSRSPPHPISNFSGMPIEVKASQPDKDTVCLSRVGWNHCKAGRSSFRVPTSKP